jgi:hypothetical protein
MIALERHTSVAVVAINGIIKNETVATPNHLDEAVDPPAYAMLHEELRLEDPASYKNYLRMNEHTFYGSSSLNLEPFILFQMVMGNK